MAHVAALLLAVGLALWAHWRTLGYELLGFDTYLQIISARIQGWSDFWGTFRETLANGRIAADFYRPVQNLSIALDYRLWNLDAFGYHVSSLTVFALCIAVIYILSRRLLGPRAWAGPLLAALYFGLHPNQLQIVPIPCRRSDMLVVLFLLLSLAVLPQRKAGPGWRTVLAGLFVLLACGAKEIGVIGVGLVALHQMTFIRWKNASQYIGGVIVATLPSLLAAGAYIINRTIVIGEIVGGYRREQLQNESEKAAAFLPQLFEDLFYSWPLVSGIDALTIATAIGITLGVVAILVLGIGFVVRGESAKRSARAVLLGIAWLTPPLLLIGKGTDYRSWYAIVPAAGVALAIGGLTHAGFALIRRRGIALVPGVLLSTIMLASVVAALGASPLVWRYDEWGEASRELRTQLNDLDALLDSVSLGQDYTFDVIDEYVPPADAARPRLQFVTVLSLRMVRSYCQLTRRDLPIDVVYHVKYESVKAAPDQILLKIRKLPVAGGVWSSSDE